METNTLRKRILTSFPKENILNLKLSDAIIDDNWGDESFSDCLQETWEDWTAITNDQLEKGYFIFTYFSTEEILYFLPRYMIWILDTIEMETYVKEWVAIDFFMWWLEKNIKTTEYLKTVNDVQQSCIKHFVEIAIKDARYSSYFQKKFPY